MSKRGTTEGTAQSQEQADNRNGPFYGATFELCKKIEACLS